MRTTALLLLAALSVLFSGTAAHAKDFDKDPKVKLAAKKALDYLAREQRRQGYWEANQGQYRVAMTALAGTAMVAEGSTTTRGRYAKNVRLAVDYLVSMSKPNGLIGYEQDYRYTYGHGFSMLFLSQVYGEEDDLQRRKELKDVLERAVKFSVNAQTSRGGWGYVSAKDGNDFDEGSTCITQVQGLRACRNAGIPVRKDVIERAQKYIRDCMTPDGGIRYSYARQGGARPPITAAAIAAMFNSGEYDSEIVKKMLKYCENNVWPAKGNAGNVSGHWHYAHYYFAQAKYRQGEKEWAEYIGDIGPMILRKQSSDGSWREGYIGPVYTSAINATILQIGNGYLPIYQR